VRARAESVDQIAEADRFDVAAIAAPRSAAADGGTDRCALRRHRACDAEAAGAATTADALCEQAVCVHAVRDDRAHAAHGDQVAVATRVTVAAEGELRAIAFRDARCNAEPAVAAAATDALRQD